MPSSTIRLRLLGRPDVAHDDRVDVLRPERHHRLLAHLALSGRWVERADLAQLFWPMHRRELAQASLRKALHLARSLPWAAGLETQGSGVRFVVACDVDDFNASAREGRLAEALRLHRGELLDGFDDDGNRAWSDWLAGERARIAERWREVAHLRLAQAANAPHESAALARALLAADPLDEDAFIALMHAQRSLGLNDERRDTCRAFVAEFEREGLSPSERLRAWIEAADTVAAAPGGDEFVGRARELEELGALFARPECRLLTVTGPGGVGKSRLVKEAVRRLAQPFADAVWLPLDDLDGPSQLVPRLATALDIAPGPQQDAVALLAAHARGRRLIVVLDNAESVVGLGRVVERLLASLPGLRICATSRARIGVSGEWLLPLAGLELPGARESAETQLASDAARLFTAAAIAIEPRFSAAAHAHDVARLVRQVDGLPLAILLAAHWVRLLPVDAIVAEIQRSLDVLDAGEEGDERPEHRSVRATFEQSWQRLSAPEREALQALSVFTGGFPLAAACAVADAPWPLIAGVADKSLVQVQERGRASMHALIRQFADERCNAVTRRAACTHHARWFHARLADVEREFRKTGPKALDALDADLENCRAAWRFSIGEADSEALAASATPLLRYFETRGRAAEGLELFSEALAAERDVATSCSAAIVSAIAHLEFRVARTDAAAASARRALKLARASRNVDALSRSLNVLGLCCWQTGRQDEARRFLEQTLRLARERADTRAEVIALGNLCNVEQATGNYERARALMLDVLERVRALGDWIGVAIRLNGLAHLHQSRGEWSLARGYLGQGLEVTERHSIAFVRPHLLVNLAHVEFFAGDHAEAERVAHLALASAREETNGVVEATARLLLVRLLVRRRAFDEARAQLRDAVACASTSGAVGLELDAVFCFAELRAAQGSRDEAAALMRFYIARPEIEPADRALAQAELDRLGASRDAPMPSDHAALLAQIAALTPGPSAASRERGA
jgi:predicted ATPase/DNA-binding SARP family transcriptional activator